MSKQLTDEQVVEITFRLDEIITACEQCDGWWSRDVYSHAYAIKKEIVETKSEVSK